MHCLNICSGSGLQFLFSVQGLGFRVQGLSFRAWGLSRTGLVEEVSMTQGLGFRVRGFKICKK